MADVPGQFPTQILADRPAILPNGVLAPWFGQLIQMLLSYIGSPGGGGSGSGGGSTVTQQIADLASSLNAVGLAGLDGASQARLLALEQATRPLLPLPMPANDALDLPAFPVAAAPSNFLDQTFGSVWGNILFRGQYGWQVLAPGIRPNLVLRTGGVGADVFWGTARPDLPGILGTRRGTAATQAFLGDGRGNVLGEGGP